MPEISKSDKRIISQIIAKGLQNELAKGMSGFGVLLDEWKVVQPEDHREMYNAFCDHVRAFSKHVYQRYDSMPNSESSLVAAVQLKEGFITDADLAPLSEDIRNHIFNLLK
jgi:hypothetical protein